jgi:hypothetical protein
MMNVQKFAQKTKGLANPDADVKSGLLGIT